MGACGWMLAVLMSTAAAAAPGTASVVERDTIIVVQAGDHLLSLARTFLQQSPCFTRGQLVTRLREMNGLDSDTLYLGQKLRVPLRTRVPVNRPLGHPRDYAARGIYLPSRLAGSAAGRRLIRRFAAAGGNTVVFDVKNRLGELGFPLPVSTARRIGAAARPGIQQPGKLIEFLHARNLHAVARLVCFYDVLLARARPDLAPLDRTTGGSWSEGSAPTWVDPSLPEVQAYLLALVDAAAALGVDEIQLDYVRFPTGAGADEAVFAFDQEGLPRSEVIAHFVRAVKAHLEHTGVQLSAALFGVVAWGSAADAARTGQRLADLLPYLDIVCPMLYPSHFSSGFQHIADPSSRPCFIVYEGCRRVVREAGDAAVVVRPWLQAFAYRAPAYGPAYILRQMHGARAGGATGWLLWNPAGHYATALTAMELARAGPGPEVESAWARAESAVCPRPGVYGAPSGSP